MPNVGEQIEKGGRRLTPQQQKFLDNYIHGDMTQTAAARAAGYKSPNVRAVQLLNNPVVKERMEEMRDELQAKYGVTIAKSIRDLQMIRDAALSEGNYSAAIKAEETRLRASGVMVDRKHITHENIGAMNREQILEQLNSFIDKAKTRMIDITPEEDVAADSKEPQDVSITYNSDEPT